MADVSLSVVIVAHNSLDQLRGTIPALLDELQPEDELILVDNASIDGVAEAFRRMAPSARVHLMTRNLGFAGGANAGAAQASGDLLVLLNPDARVQPGWGQAIRRLWGKGFCAWMGLVLLDDGERINSSGGVLHFAGFGWAGQVGEAAAAGPIEVREVGFLSGACLAIPRERWNELDGFAQHFFMYCEDVDLSLRLRLGGGRLAVIPQAKVEHAYEFVKNVRKWRLLERNRWATVLRTYPTPLLVLVLPGLLAAELAVWVVAVRGGWWRMKALATLDVIRWLPRLPDERRTIHASATVDAATFAQWLTAELSSPYFGTVANSRIVRTLLGAYWSGVLCLLDFRRRLSGCLS